MQKIWVIHLQISLSHQHQIVSMPHHCPKYPCELMSLRSLVTHLLIRNKTRHPPPLTPPKKLVQTMTNRKE